ncbi:MAG: MFS transporter [Burkholderiales bacterium]
MRFLHVYFAFAAGYLLSYLYRTVNAVISPELTRDLALSPTSLGLLTSAYFLAFAAMQIPVGILLDRYGPRRVEPVLLALAAVGAALFAFAETLAGLAVARAVIGAGVCACLMAPLKAIAEWFPADRQASYAGWIMVAGGVGALLASVPLELALHVTDWRGVFVGLSIVTFVVAFAIAWRVPDIAKPRDAGSFRAQLAGVRSVLAHPRFWWIAPFGALVMGSFMAIQGLWAVPWLIEVEGLSRAGAAQYLLLMNGVIMIGYVALGFFGTRLARRGIHARHLFATGFAVNMAALALIVLRVPGGLAWWVLYGVGAAVNVLAFTVLNEGFGRDRAGRTSTTLNLMMFVVSFAVQWGIGVIVDAARLAWGLDNAGGLRIAFAAILAADVAALLWFVRGWKRHGVHAPVAAATAG